MPVLVPIIGRLSDGASPDGWKHCGVQAQRDDQVAKKFHFLFLFPVQRDRLDVVFNNAGSRATLRQVKNS